MCGRYTHMYTWEELHDLMTLTVPGIPIAKRYNVAPTQQAPVVRRHENGERHLELLRWGLIPSWSKDIKIGYKLINARGETVHEKPSFRAAFKSRRCLIPVSGFYEWKKSTESAQKQPYYIRGKEEVLVFAGLWERWQSPEGETIDSYSIITTEANDLLKPLHDRMPVILDPSDFEKWLGPKTTPQELRNLLLPCDPERLTYYAVSTLVNSPKQDIPECIEPDTK